MKKIFFLLGLFIPAIIYAQNSYKVDFTTILGDATCYEEGYSVLQTDIGGYLVSAGYNCSNFYWNWQDG